MTKTKQEAHSIRESNVRLLALKLNMITGPKGYGGGIRERSRPIRSAVVGLTRRTPPVFGIIITERRLAVAASYSSADSFLGLRMLGPPSRKISEFSTRRSAMAVAIVVL